MASHPFPIQAQRDRQHSVATSSLFTLVVPPDPDRSSLLRRLRTGGLSIGSAQSIGSAGSSTVTGGYGGGVGLRICGPSDLEDNFRSVKRKDEVESVLSKILKIHGRAELGASGNGGCFCLGLLDPLTNTRFNRLFSRYHVVPPADGGGQGADEAMMAQRSLDGLIAFLTCLFPYLPDAEALAYIDAAAADPLVAALLVMNRRALTIDSFITTASVEVALRSAAVAAKHSYPEEFIRGWKLASLSPEKLPTELTIDNKNWFAKTMQLIDLLRGTSTDDLQLEDLWKLAEGRLTHGTERALLKGGQLPSARGAMKRMLLSMIHGYYLKALAILPKQELTECYHRSLLIGGHCYGPLDPVSNIIINTVWYEQSFPPAIQVQPLNMISTDCLWRIAARSLYGLVSFLCNRKKDLTPDEALKNLLDARANLTVADPEQLRDHDGKKTGRRRGATVLEAYIAAALSAKHPRANLQADFLGAPKSVRNLHTFSETVLSVSDGCTFTKERFDCLLTLFRCPSSVGMAYSKHEEHHPEKLSHDIYLQTCTSRNRFWLKNERVRSKVEAALHKFNETAVHKYNLHVICGVNDFVEKEFSLDPEVKAYNPWTPYKYHYSHINFWATCEGSLAPKFFFAECSNHGTSTYWCVPVLLHPDDGISLEARPDVGMRPEAARCIYCEREMGRIFHPITEKFHGRDDFESAGDDYSNNKLLGEGYRVDWVHEVKDDAIYSNFCDGGHGGLTRSNGMVSWL